MRWREAKDRGVADDSQPLDGIEKGQENECFVEPRSLAESAGMRSANRLAAFQAVHDRPWPFSDVAARDAAWLVGFSLSAFPDTLAAMANPNPTISTDSADWTTDCTRCVGLCCIAFAHQPPAGFPGFKTLNVACRHLDPSFRCRIFPDLESEGFIVCRSYDCFGAGPAVTQRMQEERDDWTPDTVAGAKTHLDGFRHLARLRMLIVALRRHGGDEADMLADRLAAVAEAFRKTGRVDMDVETSRMLRWHEGLISAILAPLKDPASGEGTCHDHA